MSKLDHNLFPEPEEIRRLERRADIDDKVTESEKVSDLESEIGRLLMELEGVIKQKDEILKLYESLLPKFLYHVTTKNRVKSIIEEGLKPYPLLDERFEPAVCLTDDIEFGKDVARITQKVIKPEDFAVFQIPTDYLDRGLARSYLDVPNPVKPKEFMHEVFYEDPDGIRPGILIPFE